MSQKSPTSLQYACVLLALCFFMPSTLQSQVIQGPTTVRSNIAHDVSPPLRVLIQNTPKVTTGPREAEEWKRIPVPGAFQKQQQLSEDPVLQSLAPGQAQSPSANLNFDGLGQGVFGYTVHVAPPDTNGAVGATQYVQWVNTSFVILNKSTGAKITGPTSGNTLWQGFSGAPQCYQNNDGDPIVIYDKLADRWVFSQFVVVGSPTPFTQCIAVSTTNDATGSYYRYAFTYNYFDDYPKMGVWPDAYYETFNMFQGNNFVGPDACAYDRNKMLAGQSATQVCFQQTYNPSTGSVNALLPADLDGTTPPPAGSPEYLLTYNDLTLNTLELYKFHVDFTTPGNSTFTAVLPSIPVAAFNPLCGGGTCIPQPGTSQKLDSLADRPMYRLAYRNFGTHESLVVSHSVVAGSSGGVRWYEIQNPNGTPSVAQQSTYAPDSSYRWMPSIAMDQAGDLAVGYSVASSSVKPSIAYAGRLATDPVSTLQTETTVVTGTGAQTTGLSRWGDYSAMTVDPVDDCTFWFTQEYMKGTGTFNWNTRIANFKFPNCGSTVTVNPTSLTFSGQIVGTTSSSQVVTLSNTSSNSVNLSGITASGDFAETDNCGTPPTSLPGNSSCTINVTFTPTAVGTRSGTLTVNDAVGTQTVSLTGTGTLNVSLTPATYNFGSVGVGNSSTAQAFTLSNGSGASLTGISISFTGTNTGDFAESDNCGTSLGASASCTINVTFTPAANGARSAVLSVNDNGGLQTSVLSGTGTDITPPVTQITTPANGATVSSTQTVTATATDNVGVTSIQIYIDGTLAASGATSPLNYSWNTANTTNGTHTIYSTASDAAGNMSTSATVTVTVNNSVSQLLQNTGFETGTLAGWSASGALVPTASSAKHNSGNYSATLGATTVPEQNGDSWLYQTVTIPSSVTAASLNFYYWPACNDTISNDWQEAQIQSSTGTTLAQIMKVCSNTQTWTKVYFNLINYKGQTIRIYFNSHGNGDSLLTYMYVDDVTVSVKGAPTVTLSPASANFANQNVGTTSSSQIFTLTNNLSTTLSGISISFTGTNATDFAETDNCGTNIAANASCTINVTFTPAAVGSRSGTLNVSDSAGTQTSGLSGTGVGMVTLTPNSYNFGNQSVSTPTSPQSFTLTNNTASALSGLNVSVTGTNSSDFAQTNSCGTSLAVNASCNINVTFTPSAAGSRSATLSVTNSAGTQTSGLSGTGVGTVSLTPASYNFGNLNVGSTGSPQTFTLTNNTASALSSLSVSVTGTNNGDFAPSSSCGASLAVNASCTINVTFTPAGAGSRSGTLTVTDSAGTQTSGLSGTGIGIVTLTPVTFNFGNQAVSSTSSAQTFTLTNSTGSALTGLSVSFTGTNFSDFGQTNNCSTSLANNTSCTINVTFKPSVYGAESATLTVNDSAGTQTSGLSGTGTDITPPTTQVTAPANGATLSGTNTVTATATDNVGVTSIQIYIDGTLVDSGTSSPLSYSWNTANASNGTHTIYSKASDAAGNVGTSTTITVTTNNGVQQLMQNPGFEAGNLSGWTAGGALTPSVTTAKHNGGKYSAVLGSTTAPQQNGDSWLLQSVTIPSNAVGASLNYFYWGVCNDTVTNAWQEVQLQNSSGAMLAQVQKTCTTSTGWTHVYFNLINYKGQTVRIYLNAHGSGDNNATYMYVDDVTVSVK